jgi:N-acetyl-gamma-glutamyl-phosphate reductase
MRVGIIGVSGYTGLELLKILINHPKFEISYLGTTEGSEDIADIHPSLQGVYSNPVEKTDIDEVAKECDLVFLALPHKTAMSYVKELFKFDLKIVDLSADYRLKRETYESYYVPHIDSENLTNSVYGLPELYREKITEAKLIANPGCYPTASILGTAPFLKYKKEGTATIIDAKSGVSGAGKKLSETTHFVTVNDNMFAYSPIDHRHSPEIEEKLTIQSGNPEKVIFVPHLVPVTRGMLASIYIQVEEELDPIAILKEFYRDEKFIRIREKPVSMKDVAGTHYCDIYAKYSDGTLYVESAIDNLLRGASSLAVANANLLAGFPEETGLPTIATVP